MPITKGKRKDIWNEVVKNYPGDWNFLLKLIQDSIDFEKQGEFMILSVLDQNEVDDCGNYMEFFSRCSDKTTVVSNVNGILGDRLLFEVLQDLSKLGKYIYSVDPLLDENKDEKKVNEEKYNIKIENGTGMPVWKMNYRETDLDEISYFCGVGSSAIGMFLMITNNSAACWPIQITHLILEIADGDAYLLWVANCPLELERDGYCMRRR
jgi:hypothetical protein